MDVYVTLEAGVLRAGAKVWLHGFEETSRYSWRVFSWGLVSNREERR